MHKDMKHGSPTFAPYPEVGMQKCWIQHIVQERNKSGKMVIIGSVCLDKGGPCKPETCKKILFDGNLKSAKDVV